MKKLDTAYIFQSQEKRELEKKISDDIVEEIKTRKKISKMEQEEKKKERRISSIFEFSLLALTTICCIAVSSQERPNTVAVLLSVFALVGAIAMVMFNWSKQDKKGE